LQARLEPERLSLLLLLLSEVVSNAVRHAGGERLRVEVTVDGVVEASVYDGSPDLPVPRPAGPADVGGRGLLLMEALADRWGSETLSQGKRVWFQIAP
jgi:anti-sigma regulatory factor (Ser/Thr protein kinase)